MTTSQAILLCKGLADKYGSAIISDTDWLNYLNIACYEVLNKLSDDQQWGTVDVDVDSSTLDSVRPLIYQVTLTPSAGLLTNSQINNALRTASGDSSCTMFRILNVGLTSSNTIVKFAKFNNLLAYYQNVFKVPTQTTPYCVLVAGGVQIYPTLALSVTMALVKTPKVLTNTGESLDYDDYVNNAVVFTALKLAGVQIRDEAIAYDIRNTNIEAAA